MNITPVLIRGYYHYMTTLSRTRMIGEDKHTWHKSLMIVTKTAFHTLDELNDAVMKHIESGVNLPFYVQTEMDQEGTKYASGGTVIDKHKTLRWIQEECNYTLLAI